MGLPTSQSTVELPVLPRLTTTVPREYVHRASLAEVFLTGCTTHDDLRFSLTGQWPRAHTLFTSPDGSSHDPLLTAETFRQAGMFLAHAELGVPLHHRFILGNLNYTTALQNLRIALSPTDFDLEARCTEVAWRRSTASWLQLELSVRRQGNVVAHGSGSFYVIQQGVYKRLRAARRPWSGPAFDIRVDRDPLPPATVGRTSTADVVLSATDSPTSWLLTPRLDHPILFDHADDHLPGMVLLEGARQAASALVTPRTMTPASASTSFRRYVELDRPCWIDITRVSPESGGVMTVEVTGRQDDETVFTSTISGPVG